MGRALDAAEGFQEAVAKRANEFEQARCFPDDLAQSFARAGLFRLLVPAALGGLQSDPLEFVSTIEAMSRADGAAGWVLMIGATTASVAAALPEPFASDIWGAHPDVIAVGVTAPYGRAFPTDGGYRVSGRWPFGSGSNVAEWIAGGCVIDGPPGPSHLLLFHRSQVELIDNWHSSGLRGSGSCDFEVNDAFVPEGRGIILGQTPTNYRDPEYRFPLFGLLALGVCSVALGIARRAIDELVAIARAKTPTGSRSTLDQRPLVQRDVALAEATLRSARAFVLDAVEAAWHAAQSGERLSTELRRDLRLAATHGARQSAAAVDLMYNAGGGTSPYASSPLQRCFRDVHTITQHIMVQENSLLLPGRLLLGIEADTTVL